MYKKRLLMAAIMAGLSVSLAACGGSDDGSDDPTPPAPQPTPDPSPQPTPDPDPQPTPDPDPGPAPGPDPDPTPTPDPDPDPGPGPVPGGGGAGDCVNADIMQVGATWHLEYRISGFLNGTSVSDAEVLRQTDFAGHTALETEVVTLTSYSGLQPVETRVLNYSYHVGGNLMEEYGNVATASVMGIDTSTVSTYSPPYRDNKWTLGVGQAENYSYTMVSETTITGSPVPVPPTTTETVVSGTWTYNGQEAVTVPAGTFTACKMTQIVDGDTNVLWVAVGAGVQVKSVSTDGETDQTLTLEMTAGSFNGSAITP